MLHHAEGPACAYRRCAFDVRIRGAGPADLVLLCLDRLTDSLTAALKAHANAEGAARIDHLTRAHGAIAALEMGIAPDAPLADSLATFYAATRKEIARAFLSFDAGCIAGIQADFTEIAAALHHA